VAKGGLFAVMGPPEAEDEDDYSDDAMPALDDEEESEPALGSGPFEAYCETVFDEKADYQSRCDALREAIMTLLEERGG
jgi:hypothetical protein